MLGHLGCLVGIDSSVGGAGSVFSFKCLEYFGFDLLKWALNDEDEEDELLLALLLLQVTFSVFDSYFYF